MIKLVFFASLREALGCESLELEFEEPLRLSEMIKQVEEKKGKHWGEVLAGESVKIAINKEIVVNDELLSDGCEVAFLPPVTGG
ncbi:MAG: molybdopterin converting factor subunit 1 [Pseudomonadota bacterium]|nr:molybdopterin converting factor subunit 1 [Pseudomonadota bacterium]